jgi:hypothetical protein
MGSQETEPERRDSEGPQHVVQLQGFFMSQTPITQAQWREVTGWKEGPGEGALVGRREQHRPTTGGAGELGGCDGVLQPPQPALGPHLYLAERSLVSVWSASPRALFLTLNPSIPHQSAVFNPGCWFAFLGLQLSGYRLRAVPECRRRRLDFMALHAMPASPSSSVFWPIRERKARNRARLLGEGSSCTRAESNAA